MQLDKNLISFWPNFVMRQDSESAVTRAFFRQMHLQSFEFHG